MLIEEKDNVYKISMPLITDEEIRNIDNNFDNIINEFTKQFVRDKDLAIAQHIMQKQQNKISQLESDNYELNNRINDYIEERQKLIEKLEEDIKSNIPENHKNEKIIIDGQTYHQALKIYAQEILSILKGGEGE